MATVQTEEGSYGFNEAVLYAVSRPRLSNVELKREQLAAICFLYDGKDVFLWLPAGFGKSVCYEVLPFCFNFAGSKSVAIALVISPLVSLMVTKFGSLANVV